MTLKQICFIGSDYFLTKKWQHMYYGAFNMRVVSVQYVLSLHNMTRKYCPLNMRIVSLQLVLGEDRYHETIV